MYALHTHVHFYAMEHAEDNSAVTNDLRGNAMALPSVSNVYELLVCMVVPPLCHGACADIMFMTHLNASPHSTCAKHLGFTGARI